MTNKYSYLDAWTSEEISAFKEDGKDEELKQLEVKSGIVSFLSENNKVVAEGDSWFDYLPGTDVIDCLRNHQGYYIKNYAKAGDTLENMIYGTGINDDFQRTSPSIEKVLRKLGQLKPKVFLFSGGGNDLAGEEFESYLNHKNSGLSTMRDDYVNNMINQVFRKYFEDLIGRVEAVSPDTHIVTHGYGHTIPTGKGVKFLFFNFSGPWLRPALAKKGIFDSIEQRKAVEMMIDVYNQMLGELDQARPNFHHVDLRGIIDPNKDWANELHLKNSAYARVADRIHEVISSL
jgi:lysophospholipase L1-like esterase